MTIESMDSEIRRALLTTKEAEFAGLTQAGHPVSNAVYYYYSTGASTIDIATGLSYPAKANRTRNNSKIGLLMGPAVHAHDYVAIVEAGEPDTRDLEDQPVLAIAAHGAVRDQDLQANVDKYVRLFLQDHPKIGPSDWETMRQATNYWVRIWIECSPAAAYYWPTGRLDEEAPIVWEAPSGTVFPESDPRPAKKESKRPTWEAEPWYDRAKTILESFPNPIFTVQNSAGFPVPFLSLGAELIDEGFILKVPRYCPWNPVGPACLSFAVFGTFVGEMETTDDGALFRVKRLIPDLPDIFENSNKDAGTEQAYILADRLAEELDRRGQTMPEIRK